MDTLKQVYLLEMRAALARIEHMNQCAARELSKGDWQSDWSAAIRDEQAHYDGTLASLKSIHNWHRNNA